MVGSHTRIGQEIAALEEAIAHLASEFDHAYQNYLTTLGKVVRKELILASYHICTQAYPDAFIQLSFREREKLQQDLKNLAIASQNKLQNLVGQVNRDLIDEEKEDDEEDEDDDFDLEEEREKEEKPEESHAIVLSIRTPERLIRWQEAIEKGMILIIKNLSKNANRRLQQSNILPKRLPEQVLDAAAKAEAAGETIPGPKNLLTLVLETVQSEEGENPGIETATLHIVAIHLRLGEIEFSEGNLNASRHQIRNLSAKLYNLRRDYQKKLRERAVIEAESAWRACWYEDH
jgi:SepF-like predicted cell division protein (DUF552 family)